MKDRDLIKLLELKLMGRTSRIKDLEREVYSLKLQLTQTKALLTEKK